MRGEKNHSSLTGRSIMQANIQAAAGRVAKAFFDL